MGDDVFYLSRTHPIVEGLATYVLESALDEVQSEGERLLARRCGVTKTNAVTEKTSLLLLRFRFHLLVKRRGEDQNPLLAEEIRTVAFTGTPQDPNWLDEEVAATLLEAVPTGNLPVSLIKNQLQHLIGAIETLTPMIETIAWQRAESLGEAHTRVRKSAKMTGRVEVVPVLPADILGCIRAASRQRLETRRIDAR